MHEITLYVKGNGTLESNKKPLKLGTESEIKSTSLSFVLDDDIDGKYHYLKMVNGELACLFRITDKKLILSKTVTSKEGVWMMSFISSNELIRSSKLTGDYVFITTPIEAVVTKGILNDGKESEELTTLKKITSMDFDKLDIIEGITKIGPYFMYNTRKTFDLNIGKDVISIGAYAFYDAIINNLTFDKDSTLECLEEAAFYHVNLNTNTITIPKSLNSWGKHVFETSKGNIKLKFEPNSQLKELGSYAFWDTPFTSIELPDGLLTFGGNTFVIKNCGGLNKLWIPNTITSNIPSNAIFGCSQLTEIVLESEFNVSANFSDCTNLTRESIVNMLYALKNLNGENAKSLTLGLTNINKLADSEVAIATNKNWTLS